MSVANLQERESELALFDNNVMQLPGARSALKLLVAVSLADGLLIAGQAWGLASACAHLWQGEGLAAQLVWIALFLGCLVLRQAVDASRAKFLDGFAREKAGDLRMQLADSLYEQGRRAVSAHGSASLATSLIEGIDQVRVYLSLVLPRTADLIVIPCVLAIVLLVIDPISGVIAVCILPCIFFYMRMLGTMAKEKASAKLGTFQRMANHFLDVLRGMQTIKAFGRGKAFSEGIFETSEEFRHATVATLKTATISSLALDLFRVFALAAVAIMLGFRLMSGDVELLPALAVLVIVPELFAAVRRYSMDFHANLDGRNQLHAILGLIEEGVREENETEAVGLASECAGGPQLVLREISFAYPRDGSEDTTAPFALEGLSFSVSGPVKVGIVGASGAGKSTLANLLAGFAIPASGSFEVDGSPCSSLDNNLWRRRVSYIPQDPYIFHGTLAENIAFYNPTASPERIAEAARQVGLERLIAQLPQGFDTVIGEAGRGLSGGQAQRIALARVLLCDTCDVLIFDEPTAHLDIETELELKENMLPLMDGRLVFFATHRLHWMRDMDLILVLDQGKLVQLGVLDELMAAPGPFLDMLASLRGDAV